jgi:hypothetical protein
MRALLLSLALSMPLPAAAQDMLAEYWTNSGSLPPEYAWDVTVTIATDGALVLKHCTGYATEGPGCKTRKAKVSDADLQSIRDVALASGLAETPARKATDVPVGGGSSGGKVWLDGVEIPLPAFPATEDADRVASVRGAIRAAIPDRLVKKFIEGN